MDRLIGRKKELKILKTLYEKNSSDFLVIYGRRRIGKTFLIRQAFDNQITFQYCGRESVTRKMQLVFFENELKDQGLIDCPHLNNWAEAFLYLKKLLTASENRKKVVFLDEIAWMDNQKSEFLPAIEGFWNGWASARDDILLIICASSTSWILNKVFHNRGGLHNRITCSIELKQFTLSECLEYSESRVLGYDKEQILLLYMILGGVAFYWVLLEPGFSVSQNIEKLFFSSTAPLRYEFKELYCSLFKKPEEYMEIVSVLGNSGIGKTRTQIADECGIANNGKLGEMLEELIACGILYPYCPLGKTKNSTYYKLVDCFTLFYFHFLKNNSTNNWSTLENSASYKTWCGLSFERVVLLHINEVKKALSIAGYDTSCYCWVSDRTKLEDGQRGAQIDLLIDRSDKTINIVEMKWTEDGSPYVMTREDQKNLINKKTVLKTQTKTRKAIIFTLVTISGLKRNQYSELVKTEVVLDDLFKE